MILPCSCKMGGSSPPSCGAILIYATWNWLDLSYEINVSLYQQESQKPNKIHLFCLYGSKLSNYNAQIPNANLGLWVRFSSGANTNLQLGVWIYGGLVQSFNIVELSWLQLMILMTTKKLPVLPKMNDTWFMIHLIRWRSSYGSSSFPFHGNSPLSEIGRR